LHRSEVDFLSSEIPGEDGLKVIEKQLALRRPATVRDVDGHEVVLLFERWLRGDMGGTHQVDPVLPDQYFDDLSHGWIIIAENGF